MSRQLAPTDYEPEKEMKIQSPAVGVQPKREESPHAISGKKKVTRKRYDIPKTVPCHICGDLAAEHLHYGGTACYSCRAFFRRTVNSTRPMLDCANEQNCKITKDTRKRCQHCRFEKCKDVGMKTSWVLTEDGRSRLSVKSPLKRSDSPSTGNPSEDIKISEIKQITFNDNIGGDDGDGGVDDRIMGRKSYWESCEVTMTTGKMRHSSSPHRSSTSSASPAFPRKRSLTSGGYPSSSSLTSGYASSSSRCSGSSSRTSETSDFADQWPPSPTEPSSPAPCVSRDDQYLVEVHGGGENELKPRAVTSRENLLVPDTADQVKVSFPGSSEVLSVTILARGKTGEPPKDKSTSATKNQNIQEIYVDPVATNPGAMVDLKLKNSKPDIAQSSSGNGATKMNRWSNILTRLGHILSENTVPSRLHQAAGIGQAVQQERQPPKARQQEEEGLHKSKRIKVHHQQPSRTIFRFQPEVDPINSNLGLDGSAPLSSFISSSFLNHCQTNPEQELFLLEAPVDKTEALTQQERVFLSQLITIEDRVRSQVPNDLEHGRAFLECAMYENPISQSVVTAVYQNLIKRIVRFANCLQDFVELSPDDKHKLLVRNTASIINIRLARWFHPKTKLQTQMALFWAGVEIVTDTSEQQRVNLSDIFVSPWCCNSSYEDRYDYLIQQMYNLVLDDRAVVLLSIICLFNIDPSSDLEMTERISSHRNKFTVLLHRYLLDKLGSEAASEAFPKFVECLNHLNEMADILVNKRLIC